MNLLKKLIFSISDQPFQKIQKLTGDFQFPQFSFCFISVQGSPGANPASIATVKVSLATSELPDSYLDSSICRLAGVP